MFTWPRIFAVLGVFAAAGFAQATTDLQATIETHVDARDVHVRLVVTNVGDQSASTLTPEATVGRSVQGAWLVPVLEGGDRAQWDIDIPVPETPGDFMVGGRVRYLDQRGTWQSAIAGTITCARECVAVRARLGLPYGAVYLDRVGLVRVRVDNPGNERISGTLSIMLPTGLEVSSGGAAVSLGPGDSTDVDLTVENQSGIRRGPYDIFLTLAYTADTLPTVHRVTSLGSTVTLPDPAEAGKADDWGPPVLAAAALAGIVGIGLRRIRRGQKPWTTRNLGQSPGSRSRL